MKYNIHCIKTYKLYSKVEDSNSINMYDDDNIRSPVTYFYLNIKAWNKIYNQIRTGESA